MRGAVVRRFVYPVAVLACGVVFSAMWSTAAQAADKQKVVVEQFGGPSSDKLRSLVLKAIDKAAGFDAIADKKVAAVEADLGLMQTADAYGAVARELKASGFVRGTVSGGKKAKAKIVVRDGDGNTVAEDSWSGKNPAKAVDAASKQLASSLASMLGKLKGAPSGSAPVAKAEKPAKAEPKAEKADDKPARSDDDEDDGKKTKKKVAKADKSDDDEDDAAPASSSSDDADSSVRAAASEEERPSGGASGAGWTGLDASFGVHVYSRKFTYNNVGSDGSDFTPKGDQQEYNLSAAPAIALNVDYFFLRYLGVTAGGEWTPPILVSKDTNGKTFSTASYLAGGGVKGKFGLGPIELMPSVVGQIHRFSVDPKDPSSGSAPQVAPVQYTIIRPGLTARVNIGKFALIAGGGYLLVTNPGGIKTDYFPNAKAQGADGFAGAAFGLPFLSGLEARVMLDVRRYVYAMNSAASDDRITGGATDQYIGGNLSIAWTSRR